MQPGDVVDSRFSIEAIAGSGGMGVVYRAKDLKTSETVALKMVRAPVFESTVRERFLREARVLRELSHPGIVRHVASGQAGDGALYLAMEWLEGEDLRERLARGGLDVAESVAIVLPVAEALAAAHAAGVVHRDLKPSNIYLVGRASEPGFSVRVLDFGVAYDPEATSHDRPTETGVVLGTVGYLAPEQVSEGRNVDARADVFSLGCVLYECLTGQRAFSGADLVAALTKILFSESTRVRELRADVPPELDDLVARMIAKDENDRPPHAGAVADELRALPPIMPTERARAVPLRAGLTQSERRLVSFLLIDAKHEALEAEVQRHGGRLSPLEGTTSVATLVAGGAATDLAARAARCALAVRALAPRAAMALATGRGDPMAGASNGDAIDRAANLLQVARARDVGRGAGRLTSRPDDTAGYPAQGQAAGPRLPVRIDEVTAGLLDPTFDVGGDEIGLLLRRERDALEAKRTLLGRETSLVGREREMAQLVSYFDECVDEGVARAVLVTGPAGVGKSRVRYELARALSARGERFSAWLGRGDPVSAGSPFALLGQAVARAAGLQAGEPRDVAEKKLRARVARHVPQEDAARVAEFLGEIAGVPFDAPSPELSAARQDAQLMADQKRLAFQRLVVAECAEQPVVLVLEDLHWGDAPTVRLVDAALAAAENAPLFVLALARPDVHDTFPRLWHKRKVQEIRLEELKPRAAARLAREVLGQAATDAMVARVVERAGGNAFYLEELLRAVVEGRGDALPETVLAMVQARLEGLESEARRVLRAASVFGESFWLGGVNALLEGAQRTTQVHAWLETLREREWITRRPGSRFSGEPEYVFRHALVREAAYAMLTEEDQALGHRLAGAWLEATGERDASVLAEHFERGGARESAVLWYVRATSQALTANDLTAALARAERGIQSGAKGEARGTLRLLEAEARAWRGENVEAERAAIEACAYLPRGGRARYQAATRLVETATRLGHHERAAAEVAALASAGGADQADEAVRLVALSECVPPTVIAGRFETAAQLMCAIDEAVGARGSLEPLLRGHVARASSWFAVAQGDLGLGVEKDREAAFAFEEAGDPRAACQSKSSYAAGCVLLGLYDEAMVALRETLAAAEALGAHRTAAHAVQSLGLALARSGSPARAVPHLEHALEAYGAQGDVRHRGFTLVYLSQALAGAGRNDEAIARAREAEAQVASFPPVRACALANLARLLLSCGSDPAEALALARQAIRLVDELGTIEEGEEAVRLAYAEALHATGNVAEARAAIAEAKQRLLARAAKVSAARVRDSMLANVEENLRTLSLADAWGVDA
jgi:tetratricopeptide (TPR) repeat protein